MQQSLQHKTTAARTHTHIFAPLIIKVVMMLGDECSIEYDDQQHKQNSAYSSGSQHLVGAIEVSGATLSSNTKLV